MGDRRSRGDVPLLFVKYNTENPLRFLILFPRQPVDERYGETPCLQQAQAEMLNPGDYYAQRSMAYFLRWELDMKF